MKFGQYELFGRVAIGGMAEIYRGRALGEEGFEKPVAIKRILPQFARDGRFVRMLVTEARIHAQLSHRNIVQIHDLGVSEEGEYFIVLEYVDGPDLATLLEALAKVPTPRGRGLRLSDAVALYIAIELGEGIHFAHEQRSADGQPLNLVHRDISPSNVLISYAGEVKLSDFGLAKRRTDHSVVGSLKGKLAYMSPEQARRAPLDRRSDIFALGAVLFEMLTGRRLREIANDLLGWQQVASGVVPSAKALRGDLPPALEALLSRALAPLPRDRFPDARAFVAAAREALDLVPRGRTSEAVELQELLKHVTPPGAPRRRAEQSKVIRLASEFFASPGSPGVTTGSDAVTRVTAAPLPGLPPASSGEAPRPGRVPGPAPGVVPAPSAPRAATPSAPLPLTRPRRTPAAPVDSVLPVEGPRTAAAAGIGARAGGSPGPAARTPPPPPPGEPPPGRAAPSIAEAEGRSPRPTRAAAGPPIAAMIVGLLLVGFGAVATVVHLKVVPLPVLAVWMEPLRLELRSEPSGAEVLLDGVPIPRQTPTTFEVARDRRVHVVEMRREGFKPARQTIRFDRVSAAFLPVAILLEPSTRPAVQQLPRPAAEPGRGGRGKGNARPGR
jgi:serine/threonine protein kinase